MNYNYQKRKDLAFIKQSKGNRKLVAVSAYTACIAKIIDEYVDIILVGDSLGMVIYGHKNTLAVSLDMMLRHGLAVVNNSSKSFIVVDLPFGSYQSSRSKAFESSYEILSKTGANAVKLEGGLEMRDTIEFLSTRGIPVFSHIGLMPQYVNTVGGYKSQGYLEQEAEKIYRDAISLESAGAVGIILECTVENLSHQISKTLKIPVIGIGASPFCDGQILVASDLLGLEEKHHPKFVKKYENLNSIIRNAISIFADEVRKGEFPEYKNCYLSSKN